MSETICVLESIEEIGLRQEANYWRAQHARASERENFWKAQSQELQRTLSKHEASLEQFRQELAKQAATLAEKDGQIEALKARIVWLTQRLFGRSTEQTGPASPDASVSGPNPPETSAQDPPPSVEAPAVPKRKRGQQQGAKGHGRRRRGSLPRVDTTHDLPPAQRGCPKCGKPLAAAGTEDSEEIEWEVRVYRRRHRRQRYAKTCDCAGVPRIVTAPAPEKLIPKGLLATSFWVRVLLEKYLFQRPLHRVRQVLALEGLDLSQGTISGGLQRLGPLLQPVYACLQERNRQAKRWKMDETRWQVYVEVEGKNGYLWWLWVAITEDTVVYLLEPTRSAEVPRRHLGEHREGILLADRYCAYQALGLVVAFCWSHIRRDFVRIREAYPPQESWAEAWVKRINDLFQLNRQRRQGRGEPQTLARYDQEVRQAVAAMAECRDRELADPQLPPAARKALESLRRHWAGATVFVAHPEIEMDNNESERALRDPAMGRKNYFGCGSLWSGTLMVACFSIFQTLRKNHLDPQQWLVAYLEACAQNGGKPPAEVATFLPWNLSEERKQAWRHPRDPP